jgi:hypothetical protein
MSTKTTIGQFNRYIHLVYAPNKVGEMVLEQKPIPYLTDICMQAYAKIKIEDLEALVDHANSNSKFRQSRYGKKITFQDLQKDIEEAISKVNYKA